MSNGQGKAFWQSREWWTKNGLKVIALFVTVMGFMIGTIVTFNAYGDDIDSIGVKIEEMRDSIVVIEEDLEKVEEEQDTVDVDLATIIVLLQELQKDVDEIKEELDDE